MALDFHLFIGHRNSAFINEVRPLLEHYYTVSSSTIEERIINEIIEVEPDLAILDFSIEEIDVLALCEKLNDEFPHINTVIYTVLHDLPKAKKKWKKRAIDYIVGPIEAQEFVEEVNKAVRYVLLEEERRNLLRSKVNLRYNLNVRLRELKKTVAEVLRTEKWDAVQKIADEVTELEKIIQEIDGA